MTEKARGKFIVDEDRPTDWFETLYSETGESGDGVPWANMSPHPLFKSWIDANPVIGDGKTALVIGCGLGDDAIELESNGFNVTAFDVSESAIALCKKRFPNSTVEFLQADLIEGIEDWHNKFDFVLEIFTIQALPPKYEQTLIKNISDFVSRDGKLVVVTEVQKDKRTFKNGPPWLLNHSYIKSFEDCGLSLESQSTGSKPEMGDEIHLSIFQRKS
jgi:2-polyprenyl-3-methyl-5-hydroxy-6-metoxy-1,4-benzoquinol methylase